MNHKEIERRLAIHAKRKATLIRQHEAAINKKLDQIAREQARLNDMQVLYRLALEDRQRLKQADIDLYERRKYYLISPEGRVVGFNNVSEHCEYFGLIRSSVYQLLKGSLKEHKGWKKPSISPGALCTDQS